jgi:hypothetical protein
MGYTYEWKLTGIKKQNTDELSNVVVNTYWNLVGIDENGYSGSFTGATPLSLNAVDPNNFTDYQNLTEDQVIGWVKDIVSGSNRGLNYWDHIQGQIDKQINVNKYQRVMVMEADLPWSPTSGSNSYGVDPQPV